MDPFVIGVVVLVLVVGWFLFKGKPSAIFVVQVKNGTAEATDGTVTEAFLNEVTEQCLIAGVRAGEIRGVPRGVRIGLWFSPEFDPDVCQRLRNWWGMYGWLLTARSPTRR
ncbi:DUF3634 family protein [Anatilimnocola sp. NA78]|uniref:DUF3634 family protein n=1 Tax=Anatilimnocola sp. NA78 TaxID=3415683 RepID=UPI003CE5C058